MALVRYHARRHAGPPASTATASSPPTSTASGEFGQDVALDADGRIVAAGYTANGSGTEFALMRANP